VPFFNSCEDFLFSEVLMQTRIAKTECDRLIKIFRKCLDGEGSFTFANYTDMEATWESVAAQLTPVSGIHLRV